jgi:hypothetical protein
MSTAARENEETTAFLGTALARVGEAEQADFLRSYGRPSPGHDSGAQSRQGRHARLRRSRATAVAACLALGARDEDLARFVFDPRFARLRPFSAHSHTRCLHLAATRGYLDQSACESLWELGLPRFLERARRVGSLGDDDGLVINSALCTLFLGPVLHAAHFGAVWKDLWREAGRLGLLDNPYFRMQLAVIGTYAGQCGPQVDWLMQDGNGSLELADAFALVRLDRGPELLRQDAARLRGDTKVAEALVAEGQDPAVLTRLAAYVRACMRDTHNFCNEGQALMLLHWTEGIAKQLRENRCQAALDAEVTRLFQGLERIERVQRIEKSRFFRIWDRMSAGPAKDHLSRLWHQSYTQASD